MAWRCSLLRDLWQQYAEYEAAQYNPIRMGSELIYALIERSPETRLSGRTVPRPGRCHRQRAVIDQPEFAGPGIVCPDFTGFDIVYPAMDEQLPTRQARRHRLSGSAWWLDCSCLEGAGC